MPEINKANRQVCDLDIRILKTKAPLLKFDTANTTTTSIESDSVYAMAKGRRRVAFQNPMEGTLEVEAQVYPFKMFALLSDGKVEDNAVYSASQTVKATEAGKLTIEVADGTIQPGTVFAYPKGEYGAEDKLIEGTFADGAFTAKTADDIAIDTEYEIGYLVNRTGVKRISISNSKLPKDYFITASTVDKDEDGLYTPYLMTYYKATIQKNFEIAFNSEDDPASITLTFDLLEDKDGNFIDMIEIPSEASESIS